MCYCRAMTFAPRTSCRVTKGIALLNKALVLTADELDKLLLLYKINRLIRWFGIGLVDMIMSLGRAQALVYLAVVLKFNFTYLPLA